jgi:hypothetical protein
MGIKELEKEVRKEVEVGTFDEFVEFYVAGSSSRYDATWLAVSNNMSIIRYDAAEMAFGHRPDFQRYGIAALTSEEMLPINRELPLSPFRTAFDTLRIYKKEKIKKKENLS